MNKALFFIFIVVFGLYVPFSRRPDFFDGLKTPAVIHFRLDSSTHKQKPFALFTLNGQTGYSVPAGYLFRSFNEGDKVEVIYENADPTKGAVYSWWGYWITWKELLFCIIGYFVLFQAAKSIVHAPAEEAMEELRNYEKKPKTRKPRYK
ncbi:hypothetical protein GCM10027566_01730 [Arachidicoccus ginsenosidivorans]|uniref:DUF3592 domain-containing protein n=1 Tax=Arachidicoccus ginsenosidivorans TaxID=496057 RepID=A0A5B8VM17_9BACT|nr:hypothetical protein [Arachidicoccus ginsenosidivorans]QEC72634.1 hypothetical protein FSB73_14060 [Arachidicoccus ginsenosidivorans]